MNGCAKNRECDDSLLLSRFNNREEGAFAKVYSHYYYNLLHLANKLFSDTTEQPEDVVQDIFINIWNNKRQKFDSLNGLKLYVYVSIRNKFKDYIKHQKHKERFRDVINSEDYFTVQVAESEVYSIIAESISLLPEECATVFRLHLDGWDVKDIALKTGKTESTVYKQKSRSIEILKDKLPMDKLYIILTLMT